MRTFFLPFLLAAATAAPLGALADPGTATLTWRNGDALPGAIASATAESLAWNTSFFDAPAPLHWEAISRIDLPPADQATTAAEAFGVTLRDGTFLHADLAGLTAETVTIRSARHGEASLRRGEVASIRRLRGKPLVWAGPSGTAGWESVAGTSKAFQRNNAAPPPAVPPLEGTAGGALSLPYFNRAAALHIPLPEAVAVEFRLSAPGRPDFKLGPGTQAQPNSLSLETWDDEIVLVCGAMFCPVRQLAEGDCTVALHLCWNAKTRRCAVYAADGALLADWEVPASGGLGGPGLFLQNKGRQLTLESLRVRPWDGQPPAATPPGPAVRLADGRVLGGGDDPEAITATADQLTVRAAAPGQPDTVCPLADVDTIYLAPTAPAPAPGSPPGELLLYADGTYLPGKVAAIEGNVARLAVPWTDHPLAARLDGLRQLRVRAGGPAPAPIDQLDTATVDHRAIHGQLACDGGAVPRWLPVGGTQPMAFAGTVAPRITRAVPPDAGSKPTPALIYTGAGDVLPAQVRAIDRDGVEFSSGVVAATSLPANEVTAIQFHPATRQGFPGFEDPAWQATGGSSGGAPPAAARRKGGGIHLEPGNTLGNPVAMQNSEFAFRVRMQGWGAVRMRLFCAGVESKGATSLVVMSSGNQIITGIEAGEGQVEGRTQTVRGNSNGPLEVRLAVTAEGVALSIDGTLVEQYPIEAAKRLGSGLIIEPGSLWNNPPQPIDVSRFTARINPGQVPAAYINAESRAQALTVPRFMKDDPPRQALLAANGDVLRGEIEAITPAHLRFRTGLESLDVPLARVEAAIWLERPPPESPPPAPSATASLLDQLVPRTLRLKKVRLANVINFLAASVEGLVLKEPAGDNSRTADLVLGGQKLGQVLERVGAAFDLSYRAGPNGMVAFQRGAAGGREETPYEKSYWLKTDPFQGQPAAQPVLESQGIGFPAGTAATWHRDTRLLVLNNTPSAHEQLAKLLADGWSEPAAPPTHWLTLIDGGRLGLRVERFEADAITGDHPFYGACRVPLAEVYAIDPAPPAPTPAMRSLRGWQLVAAPEPVLPESGGESSSLLGKLAKPFSLPLLGGGEFSLEKERGKVVVLDFWATWCGPCVMSMPGTMSAVAGFPPERVSLVAVNQNEPAETVRKFLDRRGWQLPVALDAGPKVGAAYGAESIPLTVVVGPDGKVAWVKTGATADGEQQLTATIQKLLGGDSL